jgi:anti-sigma factor RsiW
MTSHEYDAEIGEYVDGTLPRERVTAVDAHLAGCARCRAMVLDFRTIRSAAASLEPQAPPPHVWTRLAASIEGHDPQSRWPAWLAPGLSWRPAIAAAALVALLAGGTWFAWRDAATPRGPAPVVQVTDPRDAPGPSTAQATLQMTSQVLTEQIDQLEGIVTADVAVLPDETKAVFQATGGVYDSAIGESRAALQTEPSNELAQESLFEALRSKLSLLQDMIALINEMRKGNQEGAARIVSGMEQ